MWEPSDGYKAFPSAGFPLLNTIPPVVPIFAFLSTLLHPLEGLFELPHSIWLPAHRDLASPLQFPLPPLIADTLPKLLTPPHPPTTLLALPHHFGWC